MRSLQMRFNVLAVVALPDRHANALTVVSLAVQKTDLHSVIGFADLAVAFRGLHSMRSLGEYSQSDDRLLQLRARPVFLP